MAKFEDGLGAGCGFALGQELGGFLALIVILVMLASLFSSC